MPQCNRCEDKTEYQWFELNGKWKLGTELDINSYRVHICTTQEKTGNKRNWSHFSCTICGCETRQNAKLIKPKELNLCLECDRQ